VSLTLVVNGQLWEQHLSSVHGSLPGLVPVIKGNGYGLGVPRLAQASEHMGVDTVAVGTAEELAAAVPCFRGSFLVLTPWRSPGPCLPPGLSPDRVIHTVSRADDLAELLDRKPGARFVLEVLTDLRRHGVPAGDLAGARDLLRHGGGLCEGVAMHLPLTTGRHLPKVDDLVDAVEQVTPLRRLWVSHLNPDEIALLRWKRPRLEVRPRIGTRLWLGERRALRASATVLDVQHIVRGETFGDWGRTSPRTGRLLQMSGGRAHGIGVETYRGRDSLRERVATSVRAGLDAAGRVRSPYVLDGKRLWFAEPPASQTSTLHLPRSAHVPSVGDELEVRVNLTVTNADRIVVC
jgi:Alanine racemase, N-terminal domain